MGYVVIFTTMNESVMFLKNKSEGLCKNFFYIKTVLFTSSCAHLAAPDLTGQHFTSCSDSLTKATTVKFASTNTYILDIYKESLNRL